MIDASIPLQVQQFDPMRAMADAAKIQQYRQVNETRKRLSDLMPRAAHGDQQAIDELYTIDPNIASKMDERQRAQAKELTADLGAAVRWADTPEKWQYVQQHYTQKGIDLSPYRFEDREKGLVALGKLDEYLSSAPKRETVTIDGVVMDKNTGEPLFESPYDRIIPGPNGSFYKVPRMGIGRGGQAPQQRGGSVPPPPPGFVVDGGPTPQASGGFPERPF